MFKQVRKPATPLRFEPESNFVIDADGDYWRGGIRSDHYVQSIYQFGTFHLDVESFHAFPPITLAFGFSSTELFSSSANIPAESCGSTRAARRFSASYACAKSCGNSRS